MPNERKKYVVVKFPATDETKMETVAVAPSLWINYDLNTCKWPPKKYDSNKVTRWIISLMEPKDDFEDISVQVMYEYDTYAKARKASMKAEHDSAIDTAAGESDIDKPRKKQKPARYEVTDSSELDEPNPKRPKKIICSTISDSSDEEIATDYIKDKVKELIKNKKQLSTSQYQIQKSRLKKHEIASLRNCTTSYNISQSSLSADQHSDFENVPVVLSEISNKTSANRISPIKSAVSRCSNLDKNPRLFDPLLSENISPPDETFSSSKMIIPLNNINTFEKTASSHEPTIHQSVPTSSLPSIMKNVCMQSDSHIAAVLKTLVSRQEDLNSKIDHVILMIYKVYRKLAPEEEKVSHPKNLPVLPLNNEDSFLQFQKFLMSEDNFYPTVDYFVKLMKIDEQTDEYTAVGRLCYRN